VADLLTDVIETDHDYLNMGKLKRWAGL
jgi:hypothetical protein